MSTPGLTYDSTLGQNELRLMRIESSSQPDDLKFSLERHFREKAPAYVALSYTCGNEPEIHEIHVDDKVVKIRPNLWQALHYLTAEKEAVDQEWRYIWCDAICINQPNLAEKSEQTRAMYTTYRQAEMVFARLGIDRSGKYDERAADSGGMWKAYKNRNKTDLFSEEVLTSEYLTRMWIVQEAVAARNFVPMFGRTSFQIYDHQLVRSMITAAHMGAAYRAPGFLANAGWKDNELSRPFQILNFGFNHGFESISDKLWTPIQKVLPDIVDPNSRTLTQWLRFTEQSVCANPKDRVFSLLNLLPPKDREVLDRFFPDYELTLERIQLIALAYIRHGGGGGDAMWLKGLTKREKNLDAMRLLRVRSKALQDELDLKSRVSKAYMTAAFAHARWTWTHMRQHTKTHFLGYHEADETWTNERVHTLSVIGSQPLVGELRAQTNLLKAKSWYISPPADIQNEPEELSDEAEV